VTLRSSVTRLVYSTRFLLATLSYELCNMEHTKLWTMISFKLLTLANIDLSWISIQELVYSATILKIQWKDWRCFFPFRSSRENIGSLEARAEHTPSDSQSVSMCETVNGDRCSCVRKNHARARTRTCFTALFYSSRTERTRTCDVIGFRLCALTIVW